MYCDWIKQLKGMKEHWCKLLSALIFIIQCIVNSIHQWAIAIAVYVLSHQLWIEINLVLGRLWAEYMPLILSTTQAPSLTVDTTKRSNPNLLINCIPILHPTEYFYKYNLMFAEHKKGRSPWFLLQSHINNVKHMVQCIIQYRVEKKVTWNAWNVLIGKY